MEYLTTNQIAELWGKSPRYVREVCSRGKVEGAILKDNSWCIPKDAKMPQKKVTNKTTK
ncbi:MAG: DNA-binding protein [Clostridiales bacterium]|nr:DNA-binding protein [Clostridiales bacterium]